MNWELHLAPILLLLFYGAFALLKILPSTESVQEFASMLNSKGGNILILGAFSLFFFVTGMRMVYWCLEQNIEGKLNADNAVMMMGITFVTGSCFGGSFSSMLKVMSGDTPVPPGNTSSTVTAVTTSTETKPTEPGAPAKG
jgi:hypothetical protein